MKTLLPKHYLTVLLLLGTLFLGALELARDGKTEYVIVQNPKGTPSERFAAEELQTFLRKATGADFRIVTTPPPNGKGIYVGDLPGARAVIGEKRFRALRNQESAVYTSEKALALAGGGKHGTVYAVYCFLENQLGIRFLSTSAPDHVPHHKVLTLGKLAYTQKPFFDYRWIQTIGYEGTRTPTGALFLFRNRLNIVDFNYKKPVINPKADCVTPEKYLSNPMSHNFYQIIPPRKYFKSNPEYFTQDANGKRIQRQLCFSNQSLRKEFTKNFLKMVERKRSQSQIFACSQNDFPRSFCECVPCLRYNICYSSGCGAFLDYFPELCREVGKKFPEVLIVFSAYREEHTQMPPPLYTKKNFPKNAIVVFCPIDNDFAKPYSHKNNLRHGKALQAWGKITDQLWAYYYTLPYGGKYPPSSGIGRFAADTVFAAKANARGVCYEHTYGVQPGINSTEMQTYILLKLYQDPFQDWKKLAREFCNLYYGKAASEMYDYFMEVEKKYAAYPHYLSWNSRITTFLTPAWLIASQARFERAEKAVHPDPQLLQRVREARLGLDIVTLEFYRNFKDSSMPYKESARAVYERGMATLERSLQKRYPGTLFWPDQRKVQYNRIAGPLKQFLTAAEVKVKELPVQFQSISKDRIRQVFAVSRKKCIMISMPDAAAGKAARDPEWEQNPKMAYPFRCGFYDSSRKKFVIDRKIPEKEIVPDQFHFYKLGTITLSPECIVWLGWTWRVQSSLGQFYVPGVDHQYDLWVSLKFEGPLYSPRSRLKKNQVWYDRAILIRK